MQLYRVIFVLCLSLMCFQASFAEDQIFGGGVRPGVAQDAGKSKAPVDRPPIPIPMPSATQANANSSLFEPGPGVPKAAQVPATSAQPAAQPAQPINPPAAQAPSQPATAPPSVSAPPAPQPQSAAQPVVQPPAPAAPQPTPAVTAAPAAKPVLAQSPFAGAGETEKRAIDIALDNMDIYPVLDLVLNQILGINYVVDPAIKGTISLHISGSYTRNELLNLLNSVLQMQGLSLVRGDADLYKVARKPDSSKMGSDVVVYKPGESAYRGDTVAIFQLKYIYAPNAANNIKNFLSNGATVVAETSVNALIVADTAENINKIGKILPLIDADVFKDIHWRVFTFEKTDATEVGKELEKLFQVNGIYRRPGLDPAAFHILPLKSLNGIIVVSRWPEIIDLMANWVQELDKSQLNKGSKVYVYFVQNAQATDIAQTLQMVYGLRTTGGSSRMSSSTAKSKTGTTSSRNVLVQGRTTNTMTSKTEKPDLNLDVTATGELSDEVEIIPDEINNAILIKARPRDYNIISEVLKQLDVLPRQVLIDVLIVDVNLKDDISFGVEWFLKNKGIKIDNVVYSADAALSNGTTLAQNTELGKGLAGFSYGLYNAAGGLRGLVTALAEKTDVNILSSPTILAVDGQESSIEVGDEVPTLTATTTTDGGLTTQSVQYRNAGIILKVKPFINDSGVARMEITQEVSAVTSETTGSINSPRFRTRKATTYLVAKDGQTIVIGGLIQTQKTKSSSGVPFLKDIPVLGYVFGGHGSNNNKTELLIAITPHVLKTREQADALTQEFAQRVAELRQYLDASKGKAEAAEVKKTEVEAPK
ncbi:MAG: type II secretion system secretin GspD [Dissulfuribacterales bacterium]